MNIPACDHQINIGVEFFEVFVNFRFSDFIDGHATILIVDYIYDFVNCAIQQALER